MNEELISEPKDRPTGSPGAAPAKGPRLARVKVRRHDPSTGDAAFYEEFDGVPFEDRSVLEVLHYIYRQRDPSLAYRHICTKGYCSSCMLVVNGVPVLACQYPAQPEMIIEPHPKFPVVRDLVVDLEQDSDGGWKGIEPARGSATSPLSASGPRTGGHQAQINLDKCVHCRDCMAVCPAAVYSFFKKKVQVIDGDSCLGPSCNMCVDTCWKMAISMVPRSQL